MEHNEWLSDNFNGAWNQLLFISEIQGGSHYLCYDYDRLFEVVEWTFYIEIYIASQNNKYLQVSVK